MLKLTHREKVLDPLFINDNTNDDITSNPNHLAGHNTYTYVICNILLDAS